MTPREPSLTPVCCGLPFLPSYCSRQPSSLFPQSSCTRPLHARLGKLQDPLVLARPLWGAVESITSPNRAKMSYLTSRMDGLVSKMATIILSM